MFGRKIGRSGRDAPADRPCTKSLGAEFLFRRFINDPKGDIGLRNREVLDQDVHFYPHVAIWYGNGTNSAVDTHPEPQNAKHFC